MRWTTAALALGVLSMAAGHVWAQPSTINFNVVGPADWNVGTNWVVPNFPTPVVPGADFPQEIVGISNGGVVVLNSQAPSTVFGVVLGETHDPLIPNPTEEDGTFNISGNAELQLVDPTVGGGAATFRIGDAGRGVLNFSGGEVSADQLAVGGAADSALNLSGGAVLSLSGDADLLRITRVAGPNVSVQVGGNLQVRGAFIPEITGPSHSAIRAPTGDADLGGTLRPEFNGHAPTLGDSWNLIQAGTITGAFDVVDFSQAPQLPRGAFYKVTHDEEGSGEVVLSVDRQLILNVHRGTGAASIENAIGDALDIDGYVINSPSGLLNPADGAWRSFEDDGQGGWTQANPTTSFLSELNAAGSRSIGTGAVHGLGNPYNFQPTRLGQSGDDLLFEYSTADGQIATGLVEYTGPRNTMLLTVDPATGRAVLTNDSILQADIEGYVIASASGSLSPDDAAWSSLQDQGLVAWQEASPTNFFLSELNPTASTLLTAGRSLDLGVPFALGGVEDLTLEFLLATGETLFGDVVYGEIVASGQPGDTNGDGVIDLSDLNNVRNNFGATGSADGSLAGDAFPFDGVVDLADLNGVRNNFGAGPAPVPEPSSWLLACLGLALFGLRRVRR